MLFKKINMIQLYIVIGQLVFVGKDLIHMHLQI